MKFKVRALSVNLTVEPHTFTEARDEIIDTESNAIFDACVSIRDVEIVYEDFWNYLNSENEIHDASSKVKVLSVTPIVA
ncbi:hypothetical protein [Janthinobacterium sp. 75]|uniref:hypothetical protein n=1 Tax=Janthinobacterium sp. 75 TaxID=2135628 RepID=UPI00106280E7|nr:hypothetical protein [Janthinobacterium sp. 75]TDY36860.1 hypothetical protein C8C89_4765 [Janthinobacterium sp. 75]